MMKEDNKNKMVSERSVILSFKGILLFMIVAGLLSGCGMKRRIQPPPGQGVPQPQVEEEMIPSRVKDSGPAGGLYRKAKSLMAQGKNQQAELALERALRIEPDNGYYWYTMGKIKYRKGEYLEAVQFCLKSISLAGKDRRLVRANDDLIEKAKQDSAN